VGDVHPKLSDRFSLDTFPRVPIGQPWQLRGVDVFTVRDGKAAAKLAYVKG
jgi:hypothetical protein